MEVEETSGVLASCPLAAEGTNSSKDLRESRKWESEIHKQWMNGRVVDQSL